MSDTPFFVVDKIHGRCLELGGDGSYEACQTLLRELQEVFGARFSEHLECGTRPDADKEKGYWNVELFDQHFFVMRDRGYGMCIWGPQEPADIDGFLRLAEHFSAREQVSFVKRVTRWLHPAKRCP